MESMKWFLAVASTVGLFGIVALLFFVDVPNAVENVLFTVIGGIVTKWGTIVDFNFGSSSGSQRKTDMIDAMTGTGDGTGKTTTKVDTKTEITKTVTSETPPPTTPTVAAWISGAAYKVDDVVLVGTQKYRCLSNHTSTAEDEPGTGPSWTTNWERQP